MTDFQKKVYEEVKKIPKGETRTYKQIATAIGTKAYQAVGQALKKNPDPENIPCFRVVKSDGSLGGYFGNDKKMIEKKKIMLSADKIV